MSIYSLCLPALMKSLCWNNINSGADGSSPGIPQQRPYSGQPPLGFSLPVPHLHTVAPKGSPHTPPVPVRSGWGHGPASLPLLRAADKSGDCPLCARGLGRGNPEGTRQLKAFTSPLIRRFCRKIPLQRA